MGTPAPSSAIRTWHWEDNKMNTVADVLATGFGYLYKASYVPKNKVDELLASLGACSSHAQVEDIFRKRKHKMEAVAFANIREAECNPLFTIQHIKLHHAAGGATKTLHLKPPAKGALAATDTLFEDLRQQIAPDSATNEEAMPTSTAVKGPIFSIAAGVIMTILLAVGSTATERTLSEQVFSSKWTMGTIIRWVGPFWWSVLGTLWVAGSGLLLRSRLKNPPKMLVWKTGR